MENWRETGINELQLSNYYNKWIKNVESLYYTWIETAKPNVGIFYFVDTTDVSLTKRDLLKLRILRLKRAIK